MEQPSGRAESRTAKALFRPRAARSKIIRMASAAASKASPEPILKSSSALRTLAASRGSVAHSRRGQAHRRAHGEHAEVTLEKVADGFAITAVHLTLKGKVPGADQAKFEELAGKAKAGCPVSKLLNAKITLDATLVD